MERILENVNHGVALETGVDIRRLYRRGLIGFRLIRQSDTVPIVAFSFRAYLTEKRKTNGRLSMAEVNKTQQTGSGMTDTNELQSTRTHGQEAVEDLKSEVGGVVEEYSGTAEQVWDETKERVRTFKEDADEYVRENPTKTVLTALAIGFVLGLITFRR
ncbi:MAG TPA: hypothetical protein VL136_03950 [Candidatus Babeliales bacterium]|jgi:ElaB/YqjD/DUF883 family membrane-anchored ribosome-binding protein|nr:hypothetical protein [Candidatus Babeliales bacterium]